MIQYQSERLEEIDELANKNKLNMVKGQITNGFTDRPMIKGGTQPKAIKQDPNSSKLFIGRMLMNEYIVNSHFNRSRQLPRAT